MSGATISNVVNGCKAPGPRVIDSFAEALQDPSLPQVPQPLRERTDAIRRFGTSGGCGCPSYTEPPVTDDAGLSGDAEPDGVDDPPGSVSFARDIRPIIMRTRDEAGSER